jgi:hypothetical protein
LTHALFHDNDPEMEDYVSVTSIPERNNTNSQCVSISSSHASSPAHFTSHTQEFDQVSEPQVTYDRIDLDNYHPSQPCEATLDNHLKSVQNYMNHLALILIH